MRHLGGKIFHFYAVLSFDSNFFKLHVNISTHIIVQSTVVELKTLEPQYLETRDGSKVLVEDADCSATSKEELREQLDITEKKWDRTMSVSTLYFEK